MSHLDPERLALIAVEGTTTDAERTHLATCDACSVELAELEQTVAVGRSTLAIGDLEAPPERVWQRILDDVRSIPAADAAAEPVAPSADARPKRRRGTRVLWTLAASVAAVLAVVGVWNLVRPAASVEIAAATLAAFPGHAGAAGEAVVTESSDGERTVTVTLDADADADGFREVWLITADASALVSLGELDGSEGTFVVPADIDLRDYVLVDISQEPRDADPAHSGDSIVRGELDFT
ncbi:anti-sigma factor [Microbacterium sp. SSM24]|uniref:anti-sigma factor n=1 Tax=Microbacterium sp. SSM24 TaxID=2991714 RepID=UPI0022276F6B|nr:anti-sigma factor [Microbacterium sp. SSM24]MCW3493356.1 anti-sigma factor [Microbacterium sp. SSM24]